MIVNIISSPKGGGAELLVRELHKLYKKAGHASKALYFTGSTSDLDADENILGVNPRNPINILCIRALLKSYVEQSESGITVHVHLTWPFFYVTLASIGLAGVNMVYTEHNTTNKRRKIPLFWMFERFLYSRYSKIICISEGVHKSLAGWVGTRLSNRLVMIPNGSRIYSLFERSSLQNRKPRLVSVGSLTAKKNFATVLYALTQMSDDIESYTIIGEGPERKNLEKIIQDKDLQNKVKLFGWSDAIESHLHAADIQLIPSLWEGFGLVAVEGMSTGLPVVASNVDGLREVLDVSNLSATLVNKPASINEWVAAIRKTIVDINLIGAHSVAKTSRQQADKFTLDRMAERYLDVYMQL